MGWTLCIQLGASLQIEALILDILLELMVRLAQERMHRYISLQFYTEDIRNTAYTGSHRIIAETTIGILHNGSSTNHPTDQSAGIVMFRINSPPNSTIPIRYRAIRSVKPRFEDKPYFSLNASISFDLLFHFRFLVIRM